jgi:putative FmdB family regulatory protein
MPTYDYECDACEHKFEHFQGINDALLTKCPECGKKKLRRLIGAGGAVVFKGSGFYQTDYRSDSYKQKAAAEGKSSDSGSSGDAKSGKSEAKSTESKSSESKPAPKSEK